MPRGSIAAPARRGLKIETRDDVVRGVERGRRVTASALIGEDQVARQLRPGARGIGRERGGGVAHARQRGVLDLDRRGRVFGLRAASRPPRQLPVPPTAWTVAPARIGLGGTAMSRKRWFSGMSGRSARSAAVTTAHHARHRARSIDVERGDARVRVRAARERDVDRARKGQIVDEAAAASEQRGVLTPADRSAKRGLRSGHVSSERSGHTPRDGRQEFESMRKPYSKVVQTDLV